MSRFTTLALALAATLAGANANAAIYEGSAVIGKLLFEVVSTDGASIPGYSFDTSSNPFIGSMAQANIDSSTLPGSSPTVTFASSNPLVFGSPASPFDTTQVPLTVSGHDQTATAEVSQTQISATVRTEAVTGYFGYAEAIAGAMNVGIGGPNLSVQNTLLLAAHTQVTIQASASVSAGLLGTRLVSPDTDAQFTGYAALIGGNQIAAYVAANRGSSTQRFAALTSAGISFIGLEAARLNGAHPEATTDKILSLTFINDTDSTQGYGFFADAWINGNSNPGSTLGAPSPVPEPETTSLALVGLLISGMVLRRRSA
jgi:hypothetical protein